jgi:hypothetical protein
MISATLAAKQVGCSASDAANWTRCPTEGATELHDGLLDLRHRATRDEVQAGNRLLRPEGGELFAHAALIGIRTLAVADRNSLAGIVRAHEAAKVTGVRLVVGCRLDLADGMSVLVYPTDRPAYSRLCRLLSVGMKRGGEAKCILNWDDLVDWSEGLIAVLVPDVADDACALRLRRLRDTFGDLAYMALTLRRRPNDQKRIHELNNLAQRFRRGDRRAWVVKCGGSHAVQARPAHSPCPRTPYLAGG